MAPFVQIKRKRDRKVRQPVGPIKKYVHARLTRLWRDATREFVTTLIANINVDTGMSASTVVPLALKVRIGTRINAAIRGGGPKLGGQNIGQSYNSPGFLKSKKKGRDLGRKAFKYSVGSTQRPVFVMSFEIVSLQYLLHESGLGGKAAWNSLEKASQAFTNFIKENALREPYVVPRDLTTWLLTGEVSI